MERRWQWLVMGVVAAAHVVMALWLSYAMAPLPVVQPEETVMIIELIDPAVETVSTPTAPPPDTDPRPADPVPVPVPVPVTVTVPHREPVAMEAIIEPRADPLDDPAAPREFIDPRRDPFARPRASQGFGRRASPALPDSLRPRIAGERPPDAALPELRMRDRSPQRIVGAIGRFIGGGRDAPVDAPCGGRINGGAMTADSFSPAWQAQHGCGDTKERAGYDGTVELPPGVVR